MSSKHKFLVQCSVIVLVFCSVIFVHQNRCEGDIVGANDPNQGAGDDGFNLTRDLTNRLDFLDLTLTTNMSYIEVSAEFGEGGLFEGYRYADELEIFDLFHSAGMAILHIDIGINYITGSFAEAQVLQNFLGVTAGAGTDFPFTMGISGDISGPNARLTPILGLDLRDPNRQNNRFDLESNIDNSGPTIGSWLVKSSIPEASSTLIIGFSLAGFVLGSRRRKKPIIAYDRS